MKTIFGALAALAIWCTAMPALAQDAAREQAAAEAVDHLFPAGTYDRMMRGTMERMTGQMMSSMMDVPIRDLIGQMGLPEEDMASLGDASTREIMAIIDPYHEKRMALLNAAMIDGMVDVMTLMEPDMRKGLAEAYADRFTADELAEMNTFFATPAGSKYAANAMSIFMDPKMMARLEAAIPRIVEAMPGLIGKARDAVAGLPPERKFEDLTAAEREKIERLLKRGD